MAGSASIFILCVILAVATPQTLDDIMSAPMTFQNPTPSSSCSTNWEELLPALKMIKSTSSIKKERLLNVVKIIKYLLSDEIEKNQCDKILEDLKETNNFQCPDMPDLDKIVEERLKPISDAIDGKVVIPNNIVANTEGKNNTADFSKILAKISAALAKVKERNDKEELNPSTMMPIFRSRKNGCKTDFNPPLLEALGQVGQSSQAGMNSIPKSSVFNIPCQRAIDILEETSSYVLPREAYCDLPVNINLNSILKDPKVNSDNLPFKIVPNSISCVDSDDSIAILFKPKKISLMQVYGNLLKKITITVLVPYYVSKIAV